MFYLITLVVLATLSNISVANPLRLNGGNARFRRIRSVGPGVNITQPTTVASSVPPAFPSPSLQSSASDSQTVASVAGDRSVGDDVIFRFPNGSPAATVFITTASLRSTTRPTTIQSAAPPTTTQSVTTVPLTRTPSVSSQLSGARPILSSSAAGQPLFGQPLNNQSTSAQPTQSQSTSTSSPTTVPRNGPTTTSPAAAPIIPSVRSSQSGISNRTIAPEITSEVQLTPTSPATAPNPPSTPTPQNNLAIARTLNIIFQALSPDSACNLNSSIGAVACISGQLALCGSSGTYSLVQCPPGMQCYALPKTLPGHGAEISCETAENARLVLGQNATSPSATGSQTDLGNPSTTAGNLPSSPTVIPSSSILSAPSNSRRLSASSIPTPSTFSTVTLTLLTGSLRAPNLPSELPTDEATTTVTRMITISPTSADFHTTRRTKGGPPDRPTAGGGVSSIILPGSVLIVTETVTSMATITETVTATTTVKG
ncbi:hypothetical protein GP486_005421 [Trichoglossum hirsutum]|uniref:Carbohydrate-binding module family 19 domain-containing protein n=1 Tax=Trichoglossum hirsutum TaxID=265104 RepID=A0A9P8L951_9PEZI|nr:hypothetical protein GP486_005421 [Trichoglossum hirsutum]